MSEWMTILGVLGDVLEGLQASSGLVTYALMVLVLVLGTCGVPVPEEAVFATAGAVAASGRISWALAWIVGWLSIVALDFGLYAVGRWSGPGIQRSRFGRRIGSERWAALHAFVERRGAWAVVAARFVMGTRIPVFLLAGAMGMPRFRCVLVDAAAAAISVAIPLTLGYRLARHLPALIEGLRAGRWVVFGVAVILVALVWLYARRRRHSRA